MFGFNIVQYAFVVVAVVEVYSFCINLSNYYFLKKILGMFIQKYGQTETQDGVNLSQYAVRLRTVIFNAGVRVTLEVINKGLISYTGADPFNYLDRHDGQLNNTMYNYISQSMGEYRRRLIGFINPINWFTTFLFLPQEILCYLGLYNTVAVSKFANILWWVLNFFQTFFPETLKSLISSIINLFIN